METDTNAVDYITQYSLVYRPRVQGVGSGVGYHDKGGAAIAHPLTIQVGDRYVQNQRLTLTSPRRPSLTEEQQCQQGFTL